jgi:hypothetical protein
MLKLKGTFSSMIHSWAHTCMHNGRSAHAVQPIVAGNGVDVWFHDPGSIDPEQRSGTTAGRGGSLVGSRSRSLAADHGRLKRAEHIPGIPPQFSTSSLRPYISVLSHKPADGVSLMPPPHCSLPCSIHPSPPGHLGFNWGEWTPTVGGTVGLD